MILQDEIYNSTELGRGFFPDPSQALPRCVIYEVGICGGGGVWAGQKKGCLVGRWGRGKIDLSPSEVMAARSTGSMEYL